MPVIDDSVRLRHMLDAACKAVEFADGRAREDLDTDEKLSLSLVRLIEIIGEAGRHVGEPVRDAHPEIPWREIADARNRLIHGYFDVDLDVVWTIVTTDLPVLIRQLKGMSELCE